MGDPKTTEHEVEEYYDDDRDWDDEDGDDWDECGLMHDGQCSMAGSEHCDFCCPNRMSDMFCGSPAWLRKHGIK